MSITEKYQVTARKWRPSEFASVVGQDHITQTLLNAIKQDRIHHAYIFSGPRGVGKTTSARLLAKALNCLNPDENGEPCSTCEACTAITSGRSMDVVEIDGASNNSVEDIRALRDNAKYPPVNGKYKLYIIDEVHMLSTSAFNALLKTLEEPPKHLVFIFATTEPHKVLPTILSRCQRFDFRRMQIEDIVSRLRFISQQEGMEPEDDALVVIARKGDGSMRDAQSIFDQVVAFCGPNFTYAQVNDALNLIDQEFFFRVTTMMRTGDPADAFDVVDYIMRTGYDVGEFLVGLAEHFRNLLSVLTTGSGRLIETTPAIRDRYQEDAGSLKQGDVIRALHLTLGVQNAIRSASQPRLRLELLLIQLAVMDSTVGLSELLNAIKGMPEGGVVSAPSSSSPQSSSQTEGGSSSSTSSSSLSSVAASDNPSATTGTSSTDANAGTGSGPSNKVQEQGTSDQEKLDGKQPTASSTLSDELEGQSADNFSSKRDHVSGIKNFPTGAPPRRMNGNGSSSGVHESSMSYSNGTSSTTATNLASETSVTFAEIQGRWSSFLWTSVMTVKLSLPYCIRQSPGEVYGNVVRLFVENDFQSGLIGQYYDSLIEKCRQFFKAPLSIEVVVGAPPIALAKSTDVPAANSTNGTRHPDEDHPFIRGIVELLGAVKI